MHKPVLFGIVFAGIAVLLGAFGAHALKGRLDAPLLQVFETGVRYQMYHAIALILLGVSASAYGWWGQLAFWLFTFGILLFSGSLYLISLRPLMGTENWKFLGPMTPVGGFCFLLGWAAFLVSFLKKQSI